MDIEPIRKILHSVAATLLLGVGFANGAAAQTPNMLGCYRLISDDSGGRHPHPAVFRLNAERPDWSPAIERIARASATKVDTNAMFGDWRRALPDPWDRSSRHLWGSAWRTLGADTLEVKWSDGFGWMNLLLALKGDTLRGILRLGGDQVGYDVTMPAKAFRVECPPDLARPDPRYY